MSKFRQNCILLCWTPVGEACKVYGKSSGDGVNRHRRRISADDALHPRQGFFWHPYNIHIEISQPTAFLHRDLHLPLYRIYWFSVKQLSLTFNNALYRKCKVMANAVFNSNNTNHGVNYMIMYFTLHGAYIEAPFVVLT